MTLVRRAAASGLPVVSLIKLLAIFSTPLPVEKVHPLEFGIFRMRHPSERRPGLKREHPLIFWPSFAFETLLKYATMARTVVRFAILWARITRDPNAKAYMDQALTPVNDQDDVTLDLLTKTTGAREAISHQKKVARLTHAAHA